MSLHECDAIGDSGLEAVADAVRGSFEPMPAEERDRVRSRLEAVTATERVPLLVRFARPLVACAVAAGVLGGVSAAVAASGPGDTLYPLRRSAAAITTSLERGPRPAALKPMQRPAETPAAAAHVVRPAPSAHAPAASPMAVQKQLVPRAKAAIEATADKKSQRVDKSNGKSSGKSGANGRVKAKSSRGRAKTIHTNGRAK